MSLLGDEHMRLVHGDGSECKDGCDAAPLPAESWCPRCNRHHAREGEAEEKCQEVSRFVNADHRRRGGEG